MTVMHHDQPAIGPLRDEMIRESLQAGRHVEAQLVHAFDTVQLLHRTRHVGGNVWQAFFGKSPGSPEIFNQRPALLRDLRRRMDRDRAIVDQFRGMDGACPEAEDENRHPAAR